MLLEKRSSLKAKLLSFDDSFLQSPRNLQSTAALPLPAKEDFPSDDRSFPPPPKNRTGSALASPPRGSRNEETTCPCWPL